MVGEGEAQRREAWITHAQLIAGKHAIGLARLASVFDGLIETGKALERGGVPDDELRLVPDGTPDELGEKEEEPMRLGEAARILGDYLHLDVEGEARLALLLGLGEDEV
jgi:hypothetical protein